MMFNSGLLKWVNSDTSKRGATTSPSNQSNHGWSPNGLVCPELVCENLFLSIKWIGVTQEVLEELEFRQIRR